MKNVLDEIKKLDILIAKRMFKLSKSEYKKMPPSPKQAKIIKYLLDHQNEEIYQKDLENAFQISKATISETLLTMEKKEIIKRIPSDTDLRKNRIILTDKSMASYEKMQTNLNNINKELTTGISNSELDSFFATLDKLENNIKKKLEEDNHD